MRSLDDDMLLKSVFQSEVALTPQWLRLTKTKKFITLVTESALIGMMLYSLSSESGSFVSRPLVPAVLISFAVLLPIWFIKACCEEIKAYENASYIVSLRKKNDINRHTVNHPNYCDIDDGFKSVLTYPATFCSCCGLLLTPGEDTCRTCGQFNIWKSPK
jgi:hypothetical protein